MGVLLLLVSMMVVLARIWCLGDIVVGRPGRRRMSVYLCHYALHRPLRVGSQCCLGKTLLSDHRARPVRSY